MRKYTSSRLSRWYEKRFKQSDASFLQSPCNSNKFNRAQLVECARFARELTFDSSSLSRIIHLFQYQLCQFDLNGRSTQNDKQNQMKTTTIMYFLHSVYIMDSHCVNILVQHCLHSLLFSVSFCQRISATLTQLISFTLSLSILIWFLISFLLAFFLSLVVATSVIRVWRRLRVSAANDRKMVKIGYFTRTIHAHHHRIIWNR